MVDPRGLAGERRRRRYTVVFRWPIQKQSSVGLFRSNIQMSKHFDCIAAGCCVWSCCHLNVLSCPCCVKMFTPGCMVRYLLFGCCVWSWCHLSVLSCFCCVKMFTPGCMVRYLLFEGVHTWVYLYLLFEGVHTWVYHKVPAVWRCSHLSVLSSMCCLKVFTPECIVLYLLFEGVHTWKYWHVPALPCIVMYLLFEGVHIWAYCQKLFEGVHTWMYCLVCAVWRCSHQSVLSCMYCLKVFTLECIVLYLLFEGVQTWVYCPVPTV